MAGVNPYIEQAKFEKPTQKFKITFLPDNKTFEVDPAKIPFNRTGLPGSILDIAYAAGVEIDHACGGVAACSTCHVIVKKGLKSCNEPLDEELDQLDNAPMASFQSRLSCQAVPNGTEDLEIEIPSWNRNAVKEEH